MTAQSSFTVAASGDITEAWGDGVAAHLLTTETATPSVVHEGKQWVRTDTNTIYTYTGSAAEANDGYGAWTSYTPTLTSSTGSPTVGNGTISGAYRYVAGRTVKFWARLVLGTTTTPGSASSVPAFSLPVAMSSAAQYTIPADIHTVLTVSGGSTFIGRGFYKSSTEVYLYYAVDGTGVYLNGVALNTPASFGSGSEWTMCGVYETTS